MQEALLGAVAGFVVCWALLVVCIRRSYRQRMADEQLNAPLLGDSNEHRLDAAIRGATERHKECRVCGFENFKRFFFCNICGEKLRSNPKSNGRSGALTASAINGGATNNAKSQVNIEGSSRSEASSLQLVECSASSELAVPRTFTQRQRRARKRKEWQRKLGVDGQLFWYRDSDCGEDLRFAGYALHFEGEVRTCAQQDAHSDGEEERHNEAQFEQQQQIATAVDSQLQAASSGVSETVDTSEPVGPTSTVDPQPEAEPRDTEAAKAAAEAQATQVAKEKCVRDLHDAISTLSVALIAASSADASKLALAHSDDKGEENPSKLQWRDVLSHASQVFPAKYAHFVTTAAALITTSESVTVTIHREQLLEDSIEALATLPVAHVRTTMRVHFVKEAGIDAGGLHREWFVMLNEKLVDQTAASCGVFKCVNQDDQTFYLNPNSTKDVGDDHLMYYYATGRLIGRALLEGYVLGFHLALPLIKIVLGIPVTFSDLEYFDPELYKNLLWIMENEDVGNLGLDFSVTEKRGDDIITVDLIPNGRSIDVTDDNKDEYLERRFRYLLFESVSSQLYVFLKGLYEVIPQELLMLFDPEEFDYLLCGSDEIDVDDWERNTRSTVGLRGHPVQTWFWEIVREMPNEYRRRLLHFATGSSRVPIAGFGALTSYDGRLCPFTLKGVRLVKDGYIWSHACFNRLDLPLHNGKAQLKAVMYATVESGDMYGFTTQ
ncbi:Hect e3 ubiquitin [Globisporangium polare]